MSAPVRALAVLSKATVRPCAFRLRIRTATTAGVLLAGGGST
jgi:hypothetical protein